MKIELSIVLPTYNRLYSLKNIFLPSIEKQLNANFELIIIDDHSTDGTADFFLGTDFKKEFPKTSERTRFYSNKTNCGAPKSRNIGAAKADADWIYIVEDDIYIESPHFLRDALDIVKGLTGRVGVLSPQRFDAVATGYYKNPPRSFARVGRLSGEVYIDNSQKYSGYVPTTHASSFILKEAYRQVEEDEKLFFGNTFRDETDLYAGITKLGYTIYYAGDKLQTLHRNDFARTGGQKKVSSMSILHQEAMVWRNHYRYLRKHYSLPAVRLMFFVIVRALKITSNVIRARFIKNMLSRCRV